MVNNKNGKTMKSLVFRKGRSPELMNVPKPVIKKDNQVLIKIMATGICGTDINILRGNYYAKDGVILGHESSGTIEEVGSKVKKVKVGDRVVLDPTYFCSNCFYCKRNRPNYCEEKSFTETGVSRDGTYAEYHVADSSFVYPLSKNVSFEKATLTEPLACVLNALNQTRLDSKSDVLVVGAGPIGLLFGLAARIRGCEVTMGDISRFRNKHAVELGFRAQDYSRLSSISLTNEREEKKFDICIDTSGKSLEELLKVVNRGGDILVAGLDYSYEVKIKPAYLTDNGIRIVGSIDSNKTFEPAINMLTEYTIFEKIITQSYAMTEYKKAFQTLGLELNQIYSDRGKISGTKVIIHPYK